MAGKDPSQPEARAVPAPRPPTAAVLVIGDELLTGKFRDENSPWLIERCRTLGIDVQRVVVLPDTVGDIVEELDRCRTRYDWVFTSGGVGPTHDDRTMQAIAASLGVPLERRAELVDVLQRKLQDQATDDALRMAEVPAGAELWWDGEIFFPQVVAGNVVIFPGVPALLRMKFDAICARLGGVPVTSRRLRTTAAEAVIAAPLRQAQERWPTVNIGSYPRYEQRPWTVIVILDSRDQAALAECEAWLRDQLADGLVQDEQPSEQA